MTDNVLKIIKDELARMLDGAADVYDQETDTYNAVGSDVKVLTKALSVAIEALSDIKSHSKKCNECGAADIAEDELKTIANILSGGKDGK